MYVPRLSARRATTAVCSGYAPLACAKHIAFRKRSDHAVSLPAAVDHPLSPPIHESSLFFCRPPIPAPLPPPRPLPIPPPFIRTPVHVYLHLQGEFRPKQSLGQNYLSDQNYVMKICNHFGDTSEGGRRVLELGPGAGALTQVGCAGGGFTGVQGSSGWERLVQWWPWWCVHTCACGGGGVGLLCWCCRLRNTAVCLYLTTQG